MRKKTKYRGIIIPAVTPLTVQYKLDEKAVERIFQRFYQHEASPFILGTTGECASIPEGLKKDYVRAAEKYKQAGTVLYAGISSNVISESIAFVKFCADHSVDAVAATLPTYYALNESQMKAYFEELADRSPLPLIIYNIPATTHMSIPVDLIEELSHHPNIIATKDSERSEQRLNRSLQLWKDREDFGHFLGWAAKSAEALIGGSDGLVPSTGNLFPCIYSVMQAAAEDGNYEKAHEMQNQSDLYGNIYQAGRTLGESLWALKVCMKELGLCEPVVMPPLKPQSKQQEQNLLESFKSIQHKVS